MDNYYCFGNLPTPPGWLILDVMRSVDHGFKTNSNLQFDRRNYAGTETHLKEFVETKDHFLIGNDSHSRAIYRRYNISDRTLDWVRENIGNFSQCGGQLFTQGSAFYPHTDGGPRRYILNYLIKSGGDNVQTCFYREPGQDIIRDCPTPLNINHANHVDLIDSVTAPEKSWMFLFGKVLHAVTGITGSRIQLSIALSSEEFLQMKERFNLTLQHYG